MALNFPGGQQDKECRVLQIKTAVSDSVDSGSETSWTQTGLIDLQFDNAILSDSHVTVMINCSIGEDHNGAWAQPMYVTAYCATDGNIGHSDRGICGGWVDFMGRADNWVQYGQQRISGAIQYNPSTTTPRYYLYRRSHSSFVRYVGRCANNSGSYVTGRTTMTIIEMGVT